MISSDLLFPGVAFEVVVDNREVARLGRQTNVVPTHSALDTYSDL